MTCKNEQLRLENEELREDNERLRKLLMECQPYISGWTVSFLSASELLGEIQKELNDDE